MKVENSSLDFWLRSYIFSSILIHKFIFYNLIHIFVPSSCFCLILLIYTVILIYANEITDFYG